MNVWFLSTDAALCQWLTAAIMKTFCKCSLCVRRVVNIFFVMSEVVGPCRPLSAPCSRVITCVTETQYHSRELWQALVIQLLGGRFCWMA